MYRHGCIHVEESNLRTECNARHTVSTVTSTYIWTRSVRRRRYQQGYIGLN